MGRNLVIWSIAVLFLYSGVVSAVNLLTNPGFEAPVVASSNTNVATVPTGWRVPTGWTASAVGLNKWVAPGGSYSYLGAPASGVQRLTGNDILLVQDVPSIEANTVYTFTVSVLPSDVANGNGNGRTSLRIYDGTNYVVLASSPDFYDSGLVYRVWTTVTIQWDSTNYPQTWGKSISPTICVYSGLRYYFDDASLTKAASPKKISITRELPQEYIAVSENGATYSFDVQLLQAPTSNVSVIMEPNNPSDPNNNPQVDVGATTLTFTPANWATAQTVTVSAIDDAVSEAILFENINFSVVSSDPAYNSSDPNNNNSFPAPLAVKVVDNDGGQMLYNGSFELPAKTKETWEHRGVPQTGWVDLYSRSMYAYNPPSSSAIQPTDGDLRFTLASGSDIMQPIGALIEANTSYVFALDVYGSTFSTTGDDKIKIVCYDSAGMTFLSNLTILAESYYPSFTTARWNRVSLLWNSSSAPQYVGKRLAVITASQNTAIIMDNASFRQTIVSIAETGGTTDVWERASLGNTDTYTVVLDRAPASSVAITATSSDVANVQVSPATLTFDSSNWQTPQTFTVTAVDDTTNEGLKVYAISHSAVSSDSLFNGTYIRPVNVTVRDDDRQELIVTDATGLALRAPLAVSEAGPTSATYGVSLTIAPTADVIVYLASGTAVTVAPSQLTFTTANWATPQTVTVTAVDDSLRETNPEIVSISHTIHSLDTAYAAVVPLYVSVSVTENDFCGNWGYYPGDINKDCNVDMTDLQTFVLSWLECSDPADPLCTQP